jgi:cytochrome oxidase Cu insertion factor (SCO1/SenC/PrrC family)
MTFPLSAAGQDTLKSGKIISWDNHFKSRYGKYVGIKYPDFTVNLSGKSSFSNKNLDNKVVFINFWFSHCTPCIEEIEGLNRMFSSLKDRSDFLFVSFTFDSDDLIKTSVERYNIQYKVIRLDKTEFSRLNFGNPNPTNIILDKNGIIRYFTVGGADKIYQNEIIMKIYYPKILSLL